MQQDYNSTSPIPPPYEGGLRVKGIFAEALPDFPLVTIVTVTHNAEAHLKQAMESVMAQTYPNIEYIVIDGGSTDNTLEIIKSFEDKIAFWRSEPDNGIYDAMNKGLNLAIGSLIAFKNADDWFTPDAVKQAVDAHISSNADVVYGNTLKVWNENPLKTSLIISDHHKLSFSSRVDHRSTFIRTDLHRHYPFNTSFKIVADYYVLLQILKNGGRFQHVNTVFSYMRSGGASDTFRVYNELRIAQTILLGPFNAYINQTKNIALYCYNHFKNKLLKTLLGQKGYTEFKQRKAK